MDVGLKGDLADLQPVGCEGRIDFLFVISRSPSMADRQAKLIELFPHFIDSIEAEFEDLDFHIMVVSGDTDNSWGEADCNEECSLEECSSIGYPCDFMDLLTACDNTAGAGIIFPAGANAANKPCKIAGGHRYLTEPEANLNETFACMAAVGTTGQSQIAQGFIEAILPAMNEPGACNDGFLRDDALLMVTFIGSGDFDSPGSPEIWAKTLHFAKGDDPNAVVFLNITGPVLPKCAEWDRPCRFVSKFPHHVIAPRNQPEKWEQAFDEASVMVRDVCEDFMPQ